MNTNTKVTVNQMVFRNLYYRYQQFVTPLIIIAVCVLLFLYVVVPQLQGWLALRDDLTTNTQDLATLQQNVAIINKINDTQLNGMLTTATGALPADKDFLGIITSIQNAAAISGSQLGDYSFGLGDLSGIDQNGVASQLPVQLTVSLKGDLSSAQRFIAQLKKQLPLSNTIALSVGNQESVSVTVLFYYAALPKIAFQDTQPLPILSNGDVQLLNNLAANNSLQNANVASASSEVGQ